MDEPLSTVPPKRGELVLNTAVAVSLTLFAAMPLGIGLAMDSCLVPPAGERLLYVAYVAAVPTVAMIALDYLIRGVIGEARRFWAKLALRAVIGVVAWVPWAALIRLSDDRGPIGYRAPTPSDLVPYAAPAALYAALLGLAVLGAVTTLRRSRPARR